jgi:hypothetical protein
MKRTAQEWANLVDCSAESSSVLLDKEDATDLAQLLLAMVAEREAFERYDSEDNGIDAGVEWGRYMTLRTARRRAEGVDGE